eukprot:GILK01011952.1.p1 GENE.GILK01011952.1~~GILK01011952.1.p1  ORF type:complete len:223 (-),score=48.52 GILK01011952.1:106-747(-)
MSKNNVKFVENVSRRKWDKEEFARKAAERAELEGSDEDIIAVKPKKVPKPVPPLTDRTLLDVADRNLNFDDRVGKTQVVTAQSAKSDQGGFWCATCECLLKDSMAYLDHINGRKHNRLLGMSMKVERVGVDKVRDRLKSKRTVSEAKLDDIDFEKRLEQLRHDEEEKKRLNKEKKKMKKEEKRAQQVGGNEEQTEEDAMLAAMGLPTGFGGSK